MSTVDETWKDELRAAMKAHDPPLDQKDLASKIGVSRAAITKLFKPGPQQIRYKDRIHRLFGWPSATKLDEVRLRIEVGLMHLDDEDRDLVAAFVERLANKP